MSVLRAVVLVALGAWIVGAVLSALFSERVIFRPPPPGYRDGPDIVKLRTATGRTISAVFFANPAAALTILYSHGNAEDLGTVVAKAARLRDLGFAVLCYDYEGYGTSGGTPSERAAYADVDAAYDHLVRDRSIPADRILSYGLSLGGAVAADLAARRPVAGLVLESTFLSAYRVPAGVVLFPGDKFRTIDKIRGIRCPVLVMHGGADTVIPQRQGRELFEAANPPKRALWVERAAHGDLPEVAGARYDEALKEFAELAAGGGAAR